MQHTWNFQKTSPGFDTLLNSFKHNFNHDCVLVFPHSIDATAESGRLGRLLNHSTKTNNCCTKLVEFKGKPHLIIVAATDIQEGEELLYDYGDRNKESLQAHPWLAL